MKKLIIIAVLLLLLPGYAASSTGPEPPDIRILQPGLRLILLGVYGGYGLVQHTGPILTKGDGFDCCSYPDGTGNGPAFGAKAFIPVGRKFFIVPAVGGESLGGTFTSDPFAYPILGKNNTMEDATFENELEVTMMALDINVQAAYMFTGFGLYLSAGPSLSYVLSKDYTSTDQITGPPGVRFLGGGTSKEVFHGDVNITQSTFFSIKGSLGALLEVSRSLYINPEASYSLPVTTISKEGDWKVASMQGSIGVLFVL